MKAVTTTARSRAAPEAPRERSPGYAFEAKILRMGSWRIVDVPKAVSQAIGIRGSVPVVGTVRAARSRSTIPFRGSLLPRGGGRHSVVVNAKTRAELKLDFGDRIAFRLRIDHEPRILPVPDDLADALHEQGMHEAFGTIGVGMRRQWIGWIEGAVQEATRVKRIARVVEIVLRKHEARIDRELAKANG
jgi:hypothetical protein